MDYRKRASTASGGVGSKFAFGQFSYGVTHEVSDAWSKSFDSRDRGEVDGRLVTLMDGRAPGIRRGGITSEITSGKQESKPRPRLSRPILRMRIYINYSKIPRLQRVSIPGRPRDGRVF